MDPVTLILTALGTGAALGVKDTASAAVHDAYEGLKTLVKNRLAGRAGAEVILARYEEAPDSWERPLAGELAAIDAGQDADLIAAARAVIKLAGDAGVPTSKYEVQLNRAQGVQVGDGNTQTNTFGPAT